MDKWGQTGTGLLPARIEAVRSARLADERTLRMCLTEQDAILAAINLSRLTYREIARRIGVSKSTVNAWSHGERALPDRRETAFGNATGTLLLTQFRELARALREASGHMRNRDRIAAIAAPTERAWRAA